MKIRPINLDQDYPMISEWWKARDAGVMPKGVFLPAEGFIVEEGGVAMAASWLFVAPGTQKGIGVIEFTTTNPKCGLSKILLAGAKALYAHLEKVAVTKGCGSILSFVAPGRSEQHIMDRIGYTNCGGPPHLIYGKALQCL